MAEAGARRAGRGLGPDDDDEPFDPEEERRLGGRGVRAFRPKTFANLPRAGRF